MTLPDNTWARATHSFVGDALPLGAAITYAFSLSAGQNVSVTMADALHQAFTSNILPQLSTSVQTASVLLKQGPDATGNSVEWDESDTGGLAGATASPQVAAIVHKTTATGGRRGRGRLFLPGMLEANVSETGLLDATYATTLGSALVSWLSAVNATANVGQMALEHEPPYEWQIVDGQPRRVATGDAPVPTLITALSLDSRVGTQRRRNRR